MNKLKASTIKVEHLSQSDIQNMFIVFSTYYENVKFDKFHIDLFEKDKVILLRDQDVIRGFSTLKIFWIKVGSIKIKGLFSGDTIIDGGYWGQTALTMEFFKNVLIEKLKTPLNPFYWYLISKGFKTYLLLTNNFQNYCPRFDRKNTTNENVILDSFAKLLHEDNYDQSKKILVFKDKTDHLKKEIAPITEEMKENSHIKFFTEKNPNWARGDELCCVGKVDFGLAMRYLSRTLLKKLKSRTK